ncbi:MAG: hypothetical protein GXO20_00680 [Thermodesulfobacteria bacterium]|nr:hypothetical protein [Thermodesulfobacteriota bacterium]
MPTLPRLIIPDYPHHVVARANGGLEVFHEKADYLVFERILAKIKARRQIKLWAYCLMSNHVHLLLVPEKEEELSKFMQGILVSYTQYHHSKYETEGNLWRSKYFSSVVDMDTYLWKVMRYIERNPVRAGIVSFPEEYPYSSAFQKWDLIPFLDAPPLSPEEYEYYTRFCREKEPSELLEFLRQSSKKSRPLGPRSFWQKLGLKERRRGRPPSKNRI